MSALGRFSTIARQLAGNPRVRQALTGPQAKQTGSRLVDAAAAAVEKATKGRHTEKIQRARQEARRRLKP